MRKTVPPIRSLIVPVLLLVAGCATPDGLSSVPMAQSNPCPDRTVLVCLEHSSLHSRCACATRETFRNIMGHNR